MQITLPEQVEIEFEPASFGGRALAYLLDFCIRWITVALILFGILYFLSYSETSVVEKLVAALPQWATGNKHSVVYVFAFIALLSSLARTFTCV